MNKRHLVQQYMCNASVISYMDRLVLIDSTQDISLSNRLIRIPLQWRQNERDGV